MVVLDTNIIIDHLRTHSPKESQFIRLVKQFPKEKLSISLISVQELYEGKSTLDTQKEKDLLATISPLQILPYTYDTAELAGKIARDLKKPIELADAAIAATTIINNAQLFTLNSKDFNEIKELELLVL